MEHLHINKTDKFIILTSDEGYYITKYDGSNIKDYCAFTIMYCPLTINVNKYYIVDELTHKSYLKDRELIKK